MKINVWRLREGAVTIVVEADKSVSDVLAQVRQLSTPNTKAPDMLVYRGKKLPLEAKISDILTRDFETVTYFCELAPVVEVDFTNAAGASGTNVIDSDGLARALRAVLPRGGALPPGAGTQQQQAGLMQMLQAAQQQQQQQQLRQQQQQRTQRLPEVPSEAMEMLTGMGFGDVRSRKALLFSRMDVETALTWLVEHCEDPDIDADLTAEQTRQILELYQQRGSRAAGDAAAAAAAAGGAPPAGPGDPGWLEHALTHYENVFRAVALVAAGDSRPRELLEQERLPALERANWAISAAVRNIWSGVRDPLVLTALLDVNSAAMVRRIIELLSWTPEKLLEGREDAVLQVRPPDPALDKMIGESDPRFTTCAQVISAMSHGLQPDPSLLAEVDKWIDHMESLKWRIKLANEMMRVGVRDAKELCSDVDPRSASIIRCILNKVKFFEA